MAHHSFLTRLFPELEVGAAASVDPDHSIVVAPADALDAWRVAPLAGQLGPSAGIRGALGSAVAVRRAGQTPLAAATAATSAVGPSHAGEEYSAASLIDPNPVVVLDAPADALLALVPAQLPLERDAVARVGRARIAPFVVRIAIDGTRQRRRANGGEHQCDGREQASNEWFDFHDFTLSMDARARVGRCATPSQRSCSSGAPGSDAPEVLSTTVAQQPAKKIILPSPKS